MRTALTILTLFLAAPAVAQASDNPKGATVRVDPRVNERIVVEATGPRTTSVRPGDLVPVEPRVDDVGGSLSTSTRMLPLDLRVPLGFDRVYRMHGLDDTLVRTNGALVAVFNHSEYARDDDGNIHTRVPAGAEFYIGSPSVVAAHLLAAQARNLAASHLPGTETSVIIPASDPNRIQGHIFTRTTDMPLNLARDMRIDPRVRERTTTEPRVTSNIPQWMVERDLECANARTILTDDAYAAARVRELLERAAGRQSSDAPAPTPENH